MDFLPIIVLFGVALLYTPSLSVAANINCGGPSCGGTNGDDFIINIGPFESTIHGYGGNDLLIGWNGRDILIGGDGHDTIYGKNGTDLIYGGRGNDRIDGGGGNDRFYGDEGNDQITGASGSDYIVGDNTLDIGILYAGSDKLYGGPDDDIIISSTANERDFMRDYVDCGSGSDSASIRISDGDVVNSNCENIIDSDK